MTILLSLLIAMAGQAMDTVDGTAHAARSHQEPAQRGCPPDHRNSGIRIRTLLGSPLLGEMRSRFDLGTASVDDIQLLTNDRDLDTCRALWKAVETSGTNLSPGDEVTFYRSGDTFFVAVTRHRPVQPGVIRLDGTSSVDVYDPAYTLVGRFGA